MSKRWIVTALGKDRSGIVAGITQVLYRLGCNLEDSSMTRLEGEFAVMLIFSSTRTLKLETLSSAFEPLMRQLKLAVHLKPLTIAESHQPRRRQGTYLISVYGADRPGIVYQVSQALAKQGINITDVHTHRSMGKAPSLYLMLLEVELPSRIRPKKLESFLGRLAKKLKVEVSLRLSETAIL
ncbi:MAG: ACT domain-containing protein [Candidatus Omnitrophica bacterium]|nr:ACT domain-containing protein [Candidatus Omnitrophota bacterium]